MSDIKFADNTPDLIPVEVANKLSPAVTMQPASLAEAVAQEPVDFEMKPLPTKKVKVSKFWYEGRLITREEHDKLSAEQIRASNDVIRRAK